MPRPHIPAAVIAQRGRPITLIDGTEVTVVYTFSSLMRIEDDFGTLARAFAELESGEYGALMNTVSKLLAAGLEHVEPAGDRGALSDVDVLRGWLDPKHVNDYTDQVTAAIAQSFPDASAEAEGDAVDPTQDSPGESGTTSPPSPSDAQTPSSGA